MAGAIMNKVWDFLGVDTANDEEVENDNENIYGYEREEEPEEVEESDKGIDTSKLKGNVEFKNVKFGYDEDKIIIKNFNADVKEGQKIAIVGPTGAGKTTMVKLLMRFYDVNSGEILVDGHNIKDFKL